jgi:hypothetical protein
LNPRLLSQTASYDVANTIHQSLPSGACAARRQGLTRPLFSST